MNSIKIVALFGKAGAGKDTVQHYLSKEGVANINPIVSCTTRPPREGEVEGESYFFMDEETFYDKIASEDMLEFAAFRGWFYGTQKSSLSTTAVNVGVFNINGIKQLLKNPYIEVYPVLVEASDKTRLIRQLNRESNPDCKEIIRRFQTDEADFANIDFEYRIHDNDSRFDISDLTNWINSL